MESIFCGIPEDRGKDSGDLRIALAQQVLQRLFSAWRGNIRTLRTDVDEQALLMIRPTRSDKTKGVIRPAHEYPVGGLPVVKTRRNEVVSASAYREFIEPDASIAWHSTLRFRQNCVPTVTVA